MFTCTENSFSSSSSHDYWRYLITKCKCHNSATVLLYIVILVHLSEDCSFNLLWKKINKQTNKKSMTGDENMNIFMREAHSVNCFKGTLRSFWPLVALWSNVLMSGSPFFFFIFGQCDALHWSTGGSNAPAECKEEEDCKHGCRVQLIENKTRSKPSIWLDRVWSMYYDISTLLKVRTKVMNEFLL